MTYFSLLREKRQFNNKQVPTPCFDFEASFPVLFPQFWVFPLAFVLEKVPIDVI